MKRIYLLFLSLVFIGTSVFAQHDTIKRSEVGLVFSSLNSFGLCYKTGNENTLFRISALSLSGANSNIDYSNYSSNTINYPVPAGATTSFGAGLNIGFEKRKWISDKFYFYYGLLLVNSYSESQSTVVTPQSYVVGYFNSNNVYTAQSIIENNSATGNTWSLSSGLGVVVGVCFKINNSFSIGAELNPAVTYSYSSANSTSIAYGVTWTTVKGTPGYTPDVYTLPATSDRITQGVSFSIINTGASITIAYKIK